MANQSSRGGMKQGHESDPNGKQKQGVREGSTANADERHQQEPREARPASNDEEATINEEDRGAREQRHADSQHPKNGQELPDESHRPM